METFTRNLFEALSISVWEDVPVTLRRISAGRQLLCLLEPGYTARVF